MRVSVLNRGGLAVFGGSYDPHRNEVAVKVRDGESLDVVLEYPSAPTGPNADVSGMTASTPATSGNKVTFTLTDIASGGTCDVTSVCGGRNIVTRIRANIDSQVDGYGAGGFVSGDDIPDLDGLFEAELVD